MTSKIGHHFKKFVMTSKSSSWCKNVRHGVNTFVNTFVKTRHEVMTSKTRLGVFLTPWLTFWREKYEITAKNASWRQKVHHGVKNTLTPLLLSPTPTIYYLKIIHEHSHSHCHAYSHSHTPNTKPTICSQIIYYLKDNTRTLHDIILLSSHNVSM